MTVYQTNTDYTSEEINDKVTSINAFLSALSKNSCFSGSAARPFNESTRSSADADNRLDAFSGQSRSTNIYHSICYI